jgi:hypothetical protein
VGRRYRGPASKEPACPAVGSPVGSSAKIRMGSWRRSRKIRLHTTVYKSLFLNHLREHGPVAAGVFPVASAKIRQRTVRGWSKPSSCGTIAGPRSGRPQRRGRHGRGDAVSGLSARKALLGSCRGPAGRCGRAGGPDPWCSQRGGRYRNALRPRDKSAEPCDKSPGPMWRISKRSSPPDPLQVLCSPGRTSMVSPGSEVFPGVPATCRHRTVEGQAQPKASSWARPVSQGLAACAHRSWRPPERAASPAGLSTGTLRVPGRPTRKRRASDMCVRSRRHGEWECAPMGVVVGNACGARCDARRGEP